MSILLLSVPRHLKKSKILHIHFFLYKTVSLTYIVTKGKDLADSSRSYIRFFSSNTEQLMKYINIHLVPFVFNINMLAKRPRGLIFKAK